MKNLYVIDFDRTLLKTNSIILLFKKIKLPLIGFWSIFRVTKLISKRKFSYETTKIIEKYVKKNGLDNIISIIKKELNYNIIEHIKKNLTEDSFVIIISASPDVYIKDIAKHLGYIGFGSNFENGCFEYLYGIKKIKFIESKYPESKYKYYYAISDSDSDKELLNKFDKSFLFDNGKIILFHGLKS